MRRLVFCLLMGAATLAAKAGRGAPESAASRGAAAGIGELEGRYRFVGGAREEKAIAAAVEEIVQGMSFISRPMARPRLLKTNLAPRELRIEREGDALVVVFDERRYRAPLGGPAVDAVGVAGDAVKLRHRFERGSIVQTFEAERGARRNELRLADGGQLVLEVTVSSGWFERDLRYRLSFERMAPEPR